MFRELYVLCSQFGSVLDVVALKTPKMRGQAFVVFQDFRGDSPAVLQNNSCCLLNYSMMVAGSCAAASTALTKLQDFDFYGKRMRTAYSKSKSDAVAKEEGIFVPKHKRKAGEGNTVTPRHPKKSAAGPAPGSAVASSTGPAAPPDAAAPAAAPVPVSLSQLQNFVVDVLNCNRRFLPHSIAFNCAHVFFRSRKLRISPQTSCCSFKTCRTRSQRLCFRRSSSSFRVLQR